MTDYRLRCCASWTSADLADLMTLFKDRAVNIRRLSLVEAFNRPSFTQMEIRFMLSGKMSPAFLEALQQKLVAMNCPDSELVSIQSAV